MEANNAKGGIDNEYHIEVGSETRTNIILTNLRVVRWGGPFARISDYLFVLVNGTTSALVVLVFWLVDWFAGGCV